MAIFFFFFNLRVTIFSIHKGSILKAHQPGIKAIRFPTQRAELSKKLQREVVNIATCSLQSQARAQIIPINHALPYQKKKRIQNQPCFTSCAPAQYQQTQPYLHPPHQRCVAYVLTHHTCSLKALNVLVRKQCPLPFLPLKTKYKRKGSVLFVRDGQQLDLSYTSASMHMSGRLHSVNPIVTATLAFYLN